MLPAVARPLGVRDAGQRPLAEVLAAYLRPRQALIVLDNCEQVLAAMPDVATLLAACPALQILATSRAPLGLRGEYLLPVPPLALPAETGALPPDPTALAEVEAVALFVRLARAADSGFVLSVANAVAVAEVCRRLDGLPLAIELAAARVTPSLPPTAIPSLPGGSPSGAPDRRTAGRPGPAARSARHLRLVIRPALAPGEQALFRALAVFAGGFDAAAAAAVADDDPGRGAGAAGGAGRPEPRAAGTNGAQAATTLVSGFLYAVRFGLLETVREFAFERLRERGRRGRGAAGATRPTSSPLPRGPGRRSTNRG